MDPVTMAALINSGSDMLGSALGWFGNKGNVQRAQRAIGGIGAGGAPTYNPDKIIMQNRADLMGGQTQNMLSQVARRFNIDQPRARQYLLDMIFNQEASFRPYAEERKSQFDENYSQRKMQAAIAKAQLLAGMAG